MNLLVPILLLTGCLLHLSSGLLAWLSRGRFADLATIGAVAGSLCLGMAAVATLGGVASSTLTLAWAVPGGGIAIAVDALSAVFLLPIAVLGGLAAVYARGYWDGHESGPRTRAAVGLLIAGMALVVTARQGMWFLLCWEAMALAAWAALNAEHQQPSVRVAGWVNLVFTHICTICLIAMVVLLGVRSGNLDWQASSGGAHPLDGAIVVLAILGFGAKAGLLPLHVWLPGAHASAPCHVSALLSGLVLKTGIYGILRVTGMLPEPAVWWGLLLALIGAASALYGIASALTQADYKRLLACSSIENLGIIALAVGLALVARAQHHDTIAALAVSAALLHVWHHAAFKGLLFFGAGAILHGTRTRLIDRLGGLLTRMPLAGGLILVGCAAAAGLPGLAGFASEWPLYLAGFADLRGGGTIGIVTVITLALCGGAALAAYVKFYGAVFLGAARTTAGAQAHDPGRSMLVPMVVLAVLCTGLALAVPLTLPVLAPAVAVWAGPATAAAVCVPSAWWLSVAGVAMLVMLAWLWLALGARLRRISVRRAVTWDCGYAAPDPRMQYTARSFTGVLGGEMTPAPIRPLTTVVPASGLFPRLASYLALSGDGVLDRVFTPLARQAATLCQRLRQLQQGHLAMYLLYIMLTTAILLAVALR